MLNIKDINFSNSTLRGVSVLSGLFSDYQKYNDLAREASSNGDKILSENYLQHADHFTRILNEQENYKKLKFAENKSTETTHETQEVVDKTEEIDEVEKKIVTKIKTISEKETEAN